MDSIALEALSLRARVEILEYELRLRSNLISELSVLLCPADLIHLARQTRSKSAIGAVDLLGWHESTEFENANVEEILNELWASSASEGHGPR